MANKNARILWAVMTRDAGFDARHVSEKPQANKPAERDSVVGADASLLPGLRPDRSTPTTHPTNFHEGVLAKMH